MNDKQNKLREKQPVDAVEEKLSTQLGIAFAIQFFLLIYFHLPVQKKIKF